jgi:hypothetical protein
MTCVIGVAKHQKRTPAPTQALTDATHTAESLTSSDTTMPPQSKQPPVSGVHRASAASPKTLLMVTVEFPPAKSSGVHRIQSFAQDLMAQGWRVIVLTTTPNVYQQLDTDHHDLSALATHVCRTQAITSNHLFKIAGHYPAAVTIPDRYWPWLFSAIPQGKKLIQQFNVDCIWSSYPYLTAHLVAHRLATQSKLPWLADFRDPLQCHYHQGYQHGNAFTRWLERKIVTRADALCFVSEETRDLYRTLYPTLAAEQLHVIENGFSRFLAPAGHATQSRQRAIPLPQHHSSSAADHHAHHALDHGQNESAHHLVDDRFVLLYSGSLYDGHRDPTALFQALAQLKRQGMIDRKNFVLRFRGAGDGQRFQAQLQQAGIDTLVEFLPSVSHSAAMQEILTADANLLIQGEIFNYQIPAKLYDYLQAEAPVLAICPQQSATARRCQQIAQCFSGWYSVEIQSILRQWLNCRQRQVPIILHPLTPAQRQQLFSRQARSMELADVLTQLVHSRMRHEIRAT